MPNIKTKWQFQQRDIEIAGSIILDGYQHAFKMLDDRNKQITDYSYLDEPASTESYVIYFPWIKPLIKQFRELYPNDNWYCHMVLSTTKVMKALYDDDYELKDTMEIIGGLFMYFINELKLEDSFDLTLLENIAKQQGSIYLSVH
jgi:hypothetical protein